ncbi:MAG: hypothetical protein KF836_07955 [Fimbriimonadaceae bacterium]|nr:hypothetical protein [Fimbriimonadaceae bacterium]
MNIKSALKGQYRAALKMLRQCIEACPQELWLSGEHPRNYWRIAYHALFYAHLYAMPTHEHFIAWAKHKPDIECLWEAPPHEAAYSQSEELEYLEFIDHHIDEWVDALDLESQETGFPWYKNMSKLDHQIMNVRHIQGHVGQLSELLMANGIDIDWVGKHPR